MKPAVGLMGLGLMGNPMGQNLLKAGFALTVWNRTAAKAAELVQQGARLAATPREAAAASDVLLMIVSDPPAVEKILWGADGALEGLRSGSTLIDSSTISPDLARREAVACAERGADFLDAPVTGGDWGAKKGELVFMIGGREEVLERVKPVLSVLGKKFFLLGPNGAGQTVKLAMNLLLALEVNALAESLALAAAAGVRGRAFDRGDAIEHGARHGARCEGSFDAQAGISLQLPTAPDAQRYPARARIGPAAGRQSARRLRGLLHLQRRERLIERRSRLRRDRPLLARQKVSLSKNILPF